MIEVRLYGEPAPQGSKQRTRWGMREASEKVAPWRADAAHQFRQAYKGPVLNEPVSIEMEFIFPRPKGHYGTGKNAEKLKGSAPERCTSARHGDLEKLARAVNDSLSVTSGGAFLPTIG